MLDEKVKPLPPGVARNADLTTRKYSKNPDVNHFAGSRDYEGRGDAADKWLSQNDPKRRGRVNGKKQRRNLLLAEYEKERGMPKAPLSDVSIGMWKSRDEKSSKLSIFLADHLVKYIFRKGLAHGKVRLNIHGNLIRIVSIDAQGAKNRGRTYTIAQMKGGKSSRFRVQVSGANESFGVEIAAAPPTSAHFVKTMLGAAPCLEIEIPADMLIKEAPNLTEEEAQVAFSLNPTEVEPDYGSYEDMVGYDTVPDTSEEVEAEEPVETEATGVTDEQSPEPLVEEDADEVMEITMPEITQPIDQPEPEEPETVDVPTNETVEEEPVMTESIPTVETLPEIEPEAKTDVYALLMKAKSGDYVTKLDAVVAAAQLLNEAMNDPMMSVITLSIEGNRVSVDAPVVVRQKLV